MKTFFTTYTPELVSVDSPAIASNCRTIEFSNKGDQTITIDSVITLEAGESKAFGGNDGGIVNNSFALVFSGTGTKRCEIIRETIV